MAASIKHADTKFEERKPCPCKIMEHILYTSRLFGIVPVTWNHIQDACTYQLSYKWLVYSLCLLIAVLTQLVLFADSNKFTNVKYITVLLNNILDVMYLALVIILALCNVFRCKSFVKYLNQASKVMNEVDLCRSGSTLTVFIGWCTVGGCVGWMFLQTAVLGFLSLSENYSTSNTISFAITKLIQNYTAIYTVFIVCIMNTIITTLACFEKLTRSCLKYTPVHPLKSIVETNNIRDFLGIVKYEICKEDHPIPTKLYKLPPAEIVEYLRRLHEDVCLIAYQYNGCLNPQLLCGIVIALIVLIVQMYSVIVHLGFEASTRETNMVFVLNCMTILIHAVGLFIIFKSTQQYKNMVNSTTCYMKTDFTGFFQVHGLTNLLLEYSTRISSLEEHQQVRVFIDKLKNHRPFTASGIFTVDLGIIGPVSNKKIFIHRENFLFADLRKYLNVRTCGFAI